MNYDHQNYWKIRNTRQQPINFKGQEHKPILSFESEYGGEIHCCVKPGYYTFLHKNRQTGFKEMFNIPYSVFRYIIQLPLPPERQGSPYKSG